MACYWHFGLMGDSTYPQMCDTKACREDIPPALGIGSGLLLIPWGAYIVRGCPDGAGLDHACVLLRSYRTCKQGCRTNPSTQLLEKIGHSRYPLDDLFAQFRLTPLQVCWRDRLFRVGQVNAIRHVQMLDKRLFLFLTRFNELISHRTIMMPLSNRRG